MIDVVLLETWVCCKNNKIISNLAGSLSINFMFLWEKNKQTKFNSFLKLRTHEKGFIFLDLQKP